MNSYFASVEQQANPFLRGKPLGVCAYLSPYGCIIASSIESKRFGVKTGARVQDALALCPELQLVENEPAKYRSTTKKIFSIFSDYSETVEPYSIDEAFIDLTGHVQSESQALIIIEDIKQRIKNEVGEWLGCSAGISYTRWLAKYASDVGEKGSTNVLNKINRLEKLAKADITDAWGINVRIKARLTVLGICNLVELAQAKPYLLIKHFGSYGYSLWANVNGIEIERIKMNHERTPKSIGHSYQVPLKYGMPQYFNKLLMKMSEKTGRRLRAKSLTASHITLSVGYRNRTRFHKSHKLSYYLYSSQSIYTAAVHLFGGDTPLLDIRFIAVAVSGLAKAEWQQELFNDRVSERRLALALDEINDRFGEYTVLHGNMYGTEESAHDRVGYRKTLDAVFEDADIVQYDNEY